MNFFILITMVQLEFGSDHLFLWYDRLKNTPKWELNI